MQLTSPSFTDGTDMPAKYTFDGEDVSPPLEISDVPANARSLALIMEDLDSPIGPFTHWVAWNIPASTERIEPGSLPEGAEVGVNGFGEVGYGGPCPPSGRHRYRFRLYAIEDMLDATSPDRKDQIIDDMEGQVVSMATLTGYYRARA